MRQLECGCQPRDDEMDGSLGRDGYRDARRSLLLEARPGLSCNGALRLLISPPVLRSRSVGLRFAIIRNTQLAIGFAIQLPALLLLRELNIQTYIAPGPAVVITAYLLCLEGLIDFTSPLPHAISPPHSSQCALSPS